MNMLVFVSPLFVSHVEAFELHRSSAFGSCLSVFRGCQRRKSSSSESNAASHSIALFARGYGRGESNRLVGIVFLVVGFCSPCRAGS